MALDPLDAVLLSCVEALCRWRRPTAGGWGLMGSAACRLALGCSTRPVELSCVVTKETSIAEVEPFVRLGVEARVGSRLGATPQFETGGDECLRVLLEEHGVDLSVRFHPLAQGDALAQRGRWPLATVRSPSWPGWHTIASVARPEMLLADALQRMAEGDTQAADEAIWLVAQGVQRPDPAVIEGRAGRAGAASRAEVWDACQQSPHLGLRTILARMPRDPGALPAAVAVPAPAM